MDKSPLLEDYKSISPPSSPTTSNRPSLTNQQLTQPSQISQAIINPGLPHFMQRPSKAKITVYYHDSSLHFTEFEVSSSHRVLDVIQLMLSYLNHKASPTQFILRFANKQGQPKTDMPLLDPTRCVIEMNYFRFALVEKQQIDRPKIEPITDLEKSLKEPQIRSQTLQDLTPKRKKNVFCCCFSSD